MLIVVSLVSILAAGVLWLELVIRAALLYVGALLGTVVYAGLVDKNMWGHVRRWAGIMIAVILVKPVIVIVLGLAGALSSDDGPNAFSAVVSGLAIILLAIFASAMIYRFVPGFGDEIAERPQQPQGRPPTAPGRRRDLLARRAGRAGHQDPQQPRGGADGAGAAAAAAARPANPVAGGVAAHSSRTPAERRRICPLRRTPPRAAATAAPAQQPRRPRRRTGIGNNRTGGERALTTQSHPVTPRRTYLIGRARPNAIVGKNRETGEIALIIVGRVPRHDVRPARPRPVPADRAA